MHGDIVRRRDFALIIDRKITRIFSSNWVQLYENSAIKLVLNLDVDRRKISLIENPLMMKPFSQPIFCS